MAIPGYEDKDKALKLINDAKAFIQKYEDEGNPIPTLAAEDKDHAISASSSPSAHKLDDSHQLTKEFSSIQSVPELKEFAVAEKTAENLEDKDIKSQPIQQTEQKRQKRII